MGYWGYHFLSIILFLLFLLWLFISLIIFYTLFEILFEYLLQMRQMRIYWVYLWRLDREFLILIRLLKLFCCEKSPWNTFFTQVFTILVQLFCQLCNLQFLTHTTLLFLYNFFKFLIFLFLFVCFDRYFFLIFSFILRFEKVEFFFKCFWGNQLILVKELFKHLNFSLHIFWQFFLFLNCLRKILLTLWWFISSLTYSFKVFLLLLFFFILLIGIVIEIFCIQNVLWRLKRKWDLIVLVKRWSRRYWGNHP